MRARPPAALLCVCALLLCAPAAAAPRFHAPEGWLDLSPGAPAENHAELPEAVVAEAKSGKYAFFAMDLDGARDGFAANANGIVAKGAMRPRESDLPELREGLEKLMREKGAALRVAEASVVEVGGVPAIRLVNEVEMGGLSMKQLAYHVPLGREHAVLTYTSSPERFAEYLPAFEKSALATEGAQAAPLVDWGSAASAGVVGGLVGGGAALVGVLLRRRRAARTPGTERVGGPRSTLRPAGPGLSGDDGSGKPPPPFAQNG